MSTKEHKHAVDGAVRRITSGMALSGQPPMADGPSLAAFVLRRLITEGALRGGDAIRQDVLAGALGLSKPPMREALRELQAEQLVSFTPNIGFVVTKETSEELRETFELRRVLEPAVLRLAIGRLQKSDIELARSRLKAHAANRKLASEHRLNLEFHMALYLPSARPYFLKTIEQAHARSHRYVHRVLHAIGTLDRVPDDLRHSEILERAVSGDTDGACACLAIHIGEAADRLLLGWRTLIQETQPIP